MAKHMAFAPTLGSATKGGAGLKGTASATTVRAGNGKRAVHDGPFAETKEQLGGYYLVDVPDLDAAIAIANRLPPSPGARSRSVRSSGASKRRSIIRNERRGAMPAARSECSSCRHRFDCLRHRRGEQMQPQGQQNGDDREPQGQAPP